jgi:hypothetical protein
MKIEPNGLGTAENGSRSAKHENWTGALDTVKNESRNTKNENWT